MSVPAHIQQTRADLRALIDQLEAADRALAAIFPDPDATSAGPAAAPVPSAVEDGQDAGRITRVHRKPTVRPTARRESTAAVDPAAEESSADGEESAPRLRPGPEPGGGKYDAGILSALRSEQAQFGIATSDLTRFIAPRVSGPQFSSVNSSVDCALRSLLKRGLVRRDGRHWYIVREGSRG